MTLHSLVKQKAKDYIQRHEIPVGVRVYLWEDWADPMDDTEVEVWSGYAPPSDCDEYSWSEIIDSKIMAVHIESCNEIETEFSVKVSAEISLVGGSSESQEEEDSGEVKQIDFYLDIAWDEVELDFVVVDCQS